MNWRRRQMNITYCCAWIHQHREGFWQRQREAKDTAQGDLGGAGTQEGCNELLRTTWVERETSAMCRGDQRVWGQRRSLLICGGSEMVLGRGNCTSYITAPEFLILTPWSEQQSQASPWAGINIWKSPANFLHGPAVLQGSLWDDRTSTHR